MSEKLPTESVPCPSCGGTVPTTATEECEWTICPHCKYEWACPPPPTPKAPPQQPEPRQVRLKRRLRVLLFTVGLVLATTSVAICFEPVRFPSSGGIDVNPKPWIVFTCAVACYFASRPWRWFGFSVLLWAAARYGTDNMGEWLAVCVGTLWGLLLREPTEKSTLSEQSGVPEEVERPAGNPVVERRHRRERRRMRRRRRLLLLSICVLIYVPCTLLGGYLLEERKDELIRKRREAMVREREWEVNRLPGAPAHLIVLHRAPHEGFRTYADWVKELESPLHHNYWNESFRFVGKISGNSGPENRIDTPPYLEIKIRDRDDERTYDTVYFKMNTQRRLTPIELDMVFKPNDSDIGLVVIDGIFENKITFGNCAIRWHGKGDDWGTAIKEAKKGLDLSKVNRTGKAPSD